MTARETCDTNLDEQARRDFVLKRPSTVGPWITLGLGITVLAFLGSLLYINLVGPSMFSGTAERTLRTEPALLAPMRAKRATQRALERRRPAATMVPQSRALNALLGGQGPALLPEAGVRASSAARLQAQPWSGRP